MASRVELLDIVSAPDLQRSAEKPDAVPMLCGARDQADVGDHLEDLRNDNDWENEERRWKWEDIKGPFPQNCLPLFMFCRLPPLHVCQKLELNFEKTVEREGYRVMGCFSASFLPERPPSRFAIAIGPGRLLVTRADGNNWREIDAPKADGDKWFAASLDRCMQALLPDHPEAAKAILNDFSAAIQRHIRDLVRQRFGAGKAETSVDRMIRRARHEKPKSLIDDLIRALKAEEKRTEEYAVSAPLLHDEKEPATTTGHTSSSTFVEPSEAEVLKIEEIIGMRPAAELTARTNLPGPEDAADAANTPMAGADEKHLVDRQATPNSPCGVPASTSSAKPSEAEVTVEEMADVCSSPEPLATDGIVDQEDAVNASDTPNDGADKTLLSGKITFALAYALETVPWDQPLTPSEGRWELCDTGTGIDFLPSESREQMHAGFRVALSRFMEMNTHSKRARKRKLDVEEPEGPPLKKRCRSDNSWS